MARPLRIEYQGAHYHVTTRGNERKAIFRDDIDRRRFIERNGYRVAEVASYLDRDSDSHKHDAVADGQLAIVNGTEPL